MSIYQFCVNCEHISNVKVRGMHTQPYHVSQIECPARFNPYEPVRDNEDRTKLNPHGCPRNDRFMLMEEMKKTGYRPPELVSLNSPDPEDP